MEPEEQLNAIRAYVQAMFHEDVTGHDFFHMERVARLARDIARKENANEFICEAAGWIHDIGDHKLFANPGKAWQDGIDYLLSLDLTEVQITQISDAVKDVSFSKGKQIPDTLEGKIVQDADRMDAIGAIGIARTFAYGGANNQLIHHTDQKNTSIQHFYDKLLKLKDFMHTSTAKEMAQQRHQFMEDFLEQFFKEW